jgi:hypothetical protein
VPGPPLPDTNPPPLSILKTAAAAAAEKEKEKE